MTNRLVFSAVLLNTSVAVISFATGDYFWTIATSACAIASLIVRQRVDVSVNTP